MSEEPHFFSVTIKCFSLVTDQWSRHALASHWNSWIHWCDRDEAPADPAARGALWVRVASKGAECLNLLWLLVDCILDPCYEIWE